MNPQSRLLRIATLLGIFANAPFAFAQTKEQVIPLNPGWNAIHLEVQPAISSIDTQFNTIDVASVWRWDPNNTPVQFVENPSDLAIGLPQWATWFREGTNERIVANLFEFEGGRSYLINYAGSAPTQWRITGTPVAPDIGWTPGSFSLTGLLVAPGQVTFNDYFASSPGHQSFTVMRLNANGEWAFTLPSATNIVPGEAYWIRPEEASDYDGPVTAEYTQSTGIDFGLTGEFAQFVVRNRRAEPATVTLALTPSHPTPGDAGVVALSHRDYDLVGTPADPGDNATQIATPPWSPYETPLSLTIPAQGERIVYLASNRASLSPPATGATTPLTFTGLIEMSEQGGARQTIPVRMSVVSTNTVAAGAAPLKTAPPHSAAGLWVGEATLNEVSWAGGISPDIAAANPEFDQDDRNTPRPTASEFPQRVIIHVDSAGQARLLQRVIQVWEDGTVRPDPANPGLFLPDTPGRFRLVTSEAVAEQFEGAALRAGRPVPRRISTVAYPLREPLAINGNFGNTPLEGTVVLGYNDPLNPYKHTFHPQHDNMDARYNETLPPGVESYSISRSIRLEWTDEHPDGIVTPGWGNSEFGGIYRESISGVHKQTLNVSGTFTLRRISPISELD